MDFESVLELTAAILAEHPEAAAAECADRYRYFVVDEYQDVNPLQKLLLDAWTGDRDDVCVVGDPRQTIYSFTGATPSYLTGFAAEFPDATVIRLVRNYRSTPQVVALANRLRARRAAGAGAGRRRPPPGGAALVAQRPAGPEPEFTEYGDEPEEAAAVAARAAELIRSGYRARGNRGAGADQRADRAVRAGAQRGRGALPVQGAERFFDRAEVRQAIGLLRARGAVRRLAGRGARRRGQAPCCPGSG